jgi:hypothetical protein
MKHSITWALKGGGLLSRLSFIPIISVNMLAHNEAPTPQAAAFARYIASAQDRDCFLESELVAVEIDASLPALYKEAGLLAVRQPGDADGSHYQVVGLEGDVIVAEEVIAPYLAARQRLEMIPASALAITPANYRFRYRGAIGMGSNLAYVYQITPKRKDEGLIEGQIWIDAATGAEVLQRGRFVKPPRSLAGKIEMVSDTTLLNGSAVVRVTHITIEMPRLGRGELTITEAVAVSAPRRQQPIDQ